MPGRFLRKKRSRAVQAKDKPVTRKEVKQIIKRVAETKYLNFHADLVSVPSTGYINRMSTIAQGQTDSTRIGDKLRYKSMELRGEFIGADTTQLVRLILFVWKPDSNADAPAALSDVLHGTYTGSNEVPMAPYTHDLRSNFTILRDKTYALSTAGRPSVQFHWKLNNVRGKELKLIAAGNEGKNHIYMMAVSDSDVASHPTLSVISQLSYTDT